MGKKPDVSYTQTCTYGKLKPRFSINRKPEDLYERDFFVDGKMVGTFMLGNLRDMKKRKNGLITDCTDLTGEMYDNPQMHDPEGKWQMIFSVVTATEYRHKGCASALLRQMISDSKARGLSGVVLTCKERLVGFYSTFGFENEGISESVHGNVTWYQMRLTF
ncbi:MAG: GNAT family N-acetyltransferase [Spirochaetales bacterium]|nr:GNAT family N-acetyltransferase [Spirochaetales bacterium]